MESKYRVYTLMHDVTYRTAVASQNTAYNQPPHLGYYLPDAVEAMAQPVVYEVGATQSGATLDNSGKSSFDASNPQSGKGIAETTNAGFLEKAYYNFDNTLSSYATWEIFSEKSAKTTLTIRYANGGKESRDMMLVMDGVNVGTVSFPSTGDWTTYSEAKIDIVLSAGVNTLTLASLSTEGGPNVDMFSFGINGVKQYDGTQKIVGGTSDSSSSGKKDGSKKLSNKNGESDDEENGVDAISLNKPFVNNVSLNLKTGVLSSSRSGLAEILLYDMSGTLRMRVSRVVSAGSTRMIENGDVLPKGMYAVKVKFEGKLVSATRMVR